MPEYISFAYAEDPEDALVPLFLETSNPSGLKQFGTGVFVEFHSQPFLLTVAHVIDEQEHGNLVAPMLGGFDRVEGYIARIDLLPEQRRKDDHVDIAYCRLTNDCAGRLLKHFKPLPQSRLQIIPDSLELGACSVLGYPISKGKILGNKVSTDTAQFRGVAAQKEEYEIVGLDPGINIIVHFHKKKVVNRDMKPINHASPRGMSGGGIFSWPMGHELSDNWSLPKLIGLFHTYNESKGLLIGSSLVTVAAAIQLGQMKRFGT